MSEMTPAEKEQARQKAMSDAHNAQRREWREQEKRADADPLRGRIAAVVDHYIGGGYPHDTQRRAITEAVLTLVRREPVAPDPLRRIAALRRAAISAHNAYGELHARYGVEPGHPGFFADCPAEVCIEYRAILAEEEAALIAEGRAR